jgi:sugar O-acyltransferase (sialic acid O-acetyltransferase NeuD family)
MARLVGVFGIGGFGREVMPMLRRQLAHSALKFELVFVSPTELEPVNGVAVMQEDAFLESSRERFFVVAIGDGAIRRKLFFRALNRGAIPFEVRAASAEFLDPVELGHGAIICGHSSITSNTRIGIGFHLNTLSYIAHDCSIGDFVTIGPNVVCAGNVVIEDDVYIGGGAMIRQGRTGAPVIIGRGAIIGMGAVVTRSVLSGQVVVGNPARRLR